MNHPEQLESNAVAPAKKNRESGGSSAANQADRRVVPFGISNLCGRHLPLRDLAGRKDGEHAPPLQTTQCLTQRVAIRFHRAVGLKGIDKDAMILKLGHITEQKVCEHFHVRSNSSEQNREQSAIKNTVGMVRNHNDRTACGDSRLIGGIDAEIDAHFREEALEAKTRRRMLHAPIQVSHLTDRRQLSGEARKLRYAG